jgi:nucleotide-binding universal stress UspA family protein
MWKRLLVGVDGSPLAQVAAKYAFFFAKKYDAEVEGVFVADARLAAPPLPPADMLGAPLDVPAAPYIAVEESERKRGAEALVAFSDAARAASARASTVIEPGIPAPAILARLRGADAVFLGRQGRTRGADVGATVREVGWESVRPVFVATHDYREIGRILVAYDGSPESLRALRLAAELSDRGKAGFGYVILTVHDDARAAEAIQADALTFFRGHGIEPEKAIRRGSPAATICATAEELRCDLLVAGSFGQNRLREMFLGSVTSELLAKCPHPMLIHH